MTTIFLSGSRTISRLTDAVRCRIDKMMESQFDIITGDANGADKAMQSYLALKGYEKVSIYYVGDAPRNNVGNWPTHNVVSTSKSSGRDFYAQKDKEMSEVADFGLVLWDGKSAGSVQNMIWLTQNRKKAVVYLASEKRFVNLHSLDDSVKLLMEADNKTLSDIGKKISLPSALLKNNARQVALNL